MSIIKWYDQTQKAIKTNRKYQSHTCYYYKYCCFGSLAVYLWQFCFRFNPLLRFGFKILGIRFSLGVRLLVLMVNVRGKRLWENVKSVCDDVESWEQLQKSGHVTVHTGRRKSGEMSQRFLLRRNIQPTRRRSWRAAVSAVCVSMKPASWCGSRASGSAPWSGLWTDSFCCLSGEWTCRRLSQTPASLCLRVRGAAAHSVAAS